MRHAWVMIVLTLLSCAHGNEGTKEVGEASEASLIQETEQMQAAELMQDDDELDEDTCCTRQSLNDIRFARWEDTDWMDNEYIRLLRRHIDDFNAGKVSDSELEPYAEYTRCQFAIANVEPALMGGLFIQFTFLDLPNRVFDAWVYSDVDEASGKVTGYELHPIHIEDEETDFTKEEILQLAKEHPKYKALW